MSFCEELRKAGAKIWDGWLEHPFIRGIGDGTLEKEKFVYWLKQDYLYLIEYARVFAFAAGKAQKLSVMQKFAGLLEGTLNTEMSLHRRYAQKFGISPEEMEQEEMSPTTRAYTDFLVRTAAAGTLAETVAALLPCMWGFYEIGIHLAATGDTSENNPYRDWIETYSSAEFKQLADWCKKLTEEFATGTGEEEKKSMREAFITSSRYEYLFWEMGHRLEEWEI